MSRDCPLASYLQAKSGLKLEGGAFTLNAKYLPGKNNINTILRIKNHSDTVIKKIEEENKK